jgi:molybdate transport system ATP-binding protein
VIPREQASQKITFDCQLAYAGFGFEATFAAGPGVTALFGPSGSGKTTAIRLFAGIERPRHGRITINGTVVLDTAQRIFVPAHKRRIGLVYQDAQLLPHLTVDQNLRYGRWFTPKAERTIDPEPVIEVLGIGALLNRKPSALSGGERQRVAIGRALLASPRLLLMDEPLASLDAARKLEILPFIERLRDEFHIPIIYVSHALDEVARLAHQVVQLQGGRVQAVGPPAEIISAASLRETSARFNVLSSVTGVVARHRPDYDVTVLSHPAGEIIVPGRIAAVGASVRLAVPASGVSLAFHPHRDLSIRTALTGHVARIESNAEALAMVTVQLTGGEVLRASVTRLALDEMGLGVGDRVTALIKAAAVDERSVVALNPTRQNP